MICEYVIRETYRGVRKKFHKLQKTWPFKNIARFYVLRLIHDALDKMNGSEKKFVLFYENFLDDEYDKFYDPIKNVVDQLFEVTYKAWQAESKKGELDYNAYFQNSSTLEEIKKDFAKDLGALVRKTQKIFKRTLKNV
jgi:hypothetical protein